MGKLEIPPRVTVSPVKEGASFNDKETSYLPYIRVSCGKTFAFLQDATTRQTQQRIKFCTGIAILAFLAISSWSSIVLGCFMFALEAGAKEYGKPELAVKQRALNALAATILHLHLEKTIEEIISALAVNQAANQITEEVNKVIKIFDSPLILQTNDAAELELQKRELRKAHLLVEKTAESMSKIAAADGATDLHSLLFRAGFLPVRPETIG